MEKEKTVPLLEQLNCKTEAKKILARNCAYSRLEKLLSVQKYIAEDIVLKTSPCDEAYRELSETFHSVIVSEAKVLVNLK